MKKSLLLSLPIAAALLLGACGETTVEKVDGKEKQSTEKKKEEKKDVVYKVGDTVKVNGVEITITKAAFTAPAEYSEAENGKVLTLDVKVKNSSDSQAFVDSTEFGLSYGDTQAEDYYGYNDLAISQELNKGKQATGKLYFDVKSAKSYELIYSPTFAFDSKEIKWKISVK
ncbi:DUF4352 domain-containing protein [Kurthia sp. YJT4]|uniref:DUF4352 domain-containing protein n=1 Tax=Kurthia sp. YJT4 TaxID=3049086 RepID=UPI00254BBA8A|nr:DUF4352 domain-containing protein [Kurthia sp. YJT4]WIL37520.1 DUF4352 domain-containing protein [Kurthia sp. YJT4]